MLRKYLACTQQVSQGWTLHPTCVIAHGNIFMADHQRNTVWMIAEQLTGQVQSNDTSTAPHAPEAVVDGAGRHLEMVDDRCGQTGSGVEQAAVGDHEVDLLWLEACLAQYLFNGKEAGCSILKACCIYTTVFGVCSLDCWRYCCAVSQTSTVRNFVLKLNAFWTERFAGLNKLAQLAPRQMPAAKQQDHTK